MVGVTGATGAVYAIRMLRALREMGGVEVHLVLSTPARRTIVEETDVPVKEVEALGDVVHDNRDVGASIASGSFRTEGMAIVPCSIKTISSVANCYSSTLVARAADVCLKEGRPVVALVRETPLHVGHLRQLLAFAEMGGIVMPPVPAFYQRPRTVDEIVDHTVGRVLDRLGFAQSLAPEWTGRAPR